MRRGWIALLVASGCYELEDYSCQEDTDCSSAPSGVCAAFGCAYPDERCPSGLRYSDLAVGSVARTCLEPNDSGASSDTTGSSESGDSSNTTGDPTPCDAVDCAAGTCVVIDGDPACACGPGLHAVAGPRCVADPCSVNRCFYVDADAAQGGDGSLQTPWRTLAAAAEPFTANQKEGDHLMLRRGARWEEALELEDLVGTDTAPIVVGAYGTDSAPPSLQSVVLHDSTYVTIRDLEVDGAGATRSGIRAEFVDHLIVRDNYVHDVSGEGIGVHAGSEYSVVLGNTVERVLPSPEGGDLSLIAIADEWWVETASDIGNHHFVVDNVVIGLRPEDEQATDRGIMLSNRDGVGDFKVLGNQISGIRWQGLWSRGDGYAWVLFNDVGSASDAFPHHPHESVAWSSAILTSHGSKVRMIGNRVFGAGLPLLLGAGADESALEAEYNTFAGGGDAWAIWLGSVRGTFERNLVIPDDGAAAVMADGLESFDGLTLLDNVYAAVQCDVGVFGSEPLTFEEWQAMGVETGSACGPVPGVEPWTDAAAEPDEWGELEALVPGAEWDRCDAPVGARDCEGNPIVQTLRVWPSMPDNAGRGWEGPPIVRVRYPFE